MMRATFQEMPSPMMSAGMSEMIGPIYGINSMIPHITARVNVLSVSNPNIISREKSPIYVMANIEKERMSIAFIHAVVTCCI